MEERWSNKITFYIVCLFCLGITTRLFERGEACGISTHTAIGHRAMGFDSLGENYDYFQQLIEKYQPAFQAGNPYPDAMYASECYGGALHQVAEDSHWTPFQNATINYIRERYPPPWDEKTEKLVVFFLGFVSHSIADVVWHSLGVNQGFLSTMGYEDYHGSYDEAHQAGDPGGDAMVNFELNMSWMSTLDWWVPIDDLVNIYAQYYGRSGVVNATVLRVCTSILYLGRLGERIAFAKLWKKYAEHSPFLAESFYDYFLGGVDDMSAWTVLTWQKSIYMLNHGTNACTLNENPLFINCPQNSSSSTSSSLQSTLTREDKMKTRPPKTREEELQMILKMSSIGIEDLIYGFEEEGMTIRLSEEANQRLDNLLKEEEKERKGTTKRPPLLKKEGWEEEKVRDNATLTTTMMYTRLGWSLGLGDYDSDGLGDLVIGGPGYNASLGRVFLLYGNQEIVTSSLDEDTNHLDGISPYSRFGTAVTTVDLNCDQVDDLVVSAPSVGTSEIAYTGQVYVYFGQKGVGIPLNSNPDLIFSGNDTYNNLGLKLTSGDLDSDGFDDLVISSPYAPGGGSQRGEVSVYFTTQTCAGQVDSPGWERAGEYDYDWFGDSVSIFGDSPSSTSFLIVGAPRFRLCGGAPYYNGSCESFATTDLQSVGKIYGFDVWTNDTLFSVTGNENWGKFGFSLAVGNPYGSSGQTVLAVSVPTQNTSGSIEHIPVIWNQAGQVYLFALSDLDVGLSVSDLSPLAIFSGDRELGRFGWKVDFLDFNNDGTEDLVIGAPWRTDDISEELFGAEEGGLYVFFGGNEFPASGENPTLKCDLLGLIVPCPSHAASISFTPLADHTRFGFNFVSGDWNSDGKTDLAISAIMASPAKDSESGAVVVLSDF